MTEDFEWFRAVIEDHVDFSVEDEARQRLSRIEAENERLRAERDDWQRMSEWWQHMDEQDAAENERLRAAMAFLDQCTCVCAYVRRARQALEGDK